MQYNEDMINKFSIENSNILELFFIYKINLHFLILLLQQQQHVVVIYKMLGLDLLRNRIKRASKVFL